MGRFEEYINPSKRLGFGAVNFSVSKETRELMTPHREMEMCINIINSNAIIVSAIDQLSVFITGTGFEIEADDVATKNYFTNWLKNNKNLKQKIKTCFFNLFGMGNLFILKHFDKNDKGIITNGDFEIINDSSRVYYNLQAKSKNDYWLLKIPYEMARADDKASTYRINYMAGINISTEMIYAIPFEESKIGHLKAGWSRDGFYGRSTLASAESEAQAFKYIIENYSKIAKLRSVGKKIITLGSDNVPAFAKDLEILEQELMNTKDTENIITNKNISVAPLSYSGEVNTMTAELQELTKFLLMGLLPSFLTPFNSEVNRATSEDVKVMFSLQLEFYRGMFENFFTEEILNPIKQSNSHLRGNVKLKIISSDLYSHSDKVQLGLQLYQAGTITLNMLLTHYCNLEKAEDGDKYNYELQQPNNNNYFNYENIKKKKNNKEKIIIKKETEDKKKSNDEEELEKNPIYEIDKKLTSEIIDIIKNLEKKILTNVLTIALKQEAKKVNPRSIDYLKTVFTGFLGQLNSSIKKYFSLSFEQELKTDNMLKTKKDLIKKNSDYLKANAYNQVKTFFGKKQQNIRRILSQGMAQSKNISMIKKDLKDEFKSSDYEASRIVRTELMTSVAIQKLKLWDIQGYKYFYWIVSFTGRECDKCKARHKKIYLIKKALNGLIPFPGQIHPNCQCSVRLCTIREYINFKLNNIYEKIKNGSSVKKL